MSKSAKFLFEVDFKMIDLLIKVNDVEATVIIFQG